MCVKLTCRKNRIVYWNVKRVEIKKLIHYWDAKKGLLPRLIWDAFGKISCVNYSWKITIKKKRTKEREKGDTMTHTSGVHIQSSLKLICIDIWKKPKKSRSLSQLPESPTKWKTMDVIFLLPSSGSQKIGLQNCRCCLEWQSSSFFFPLICHVNF